MLAGLATRAAEYLIDPPRTALLISRRNRDNSAGFSRSHTSRCRQTGHMATETNETAALSDGNKLRVMSMVVESAGGGRLRLELRVAFPDGS